MLSFLTGDSVLHAENTSRIINLPVKNVLNPRKPPNVAIFFPCLSLARLLSAREAPCRTQPDSASVDRAARRRSVRGAGRPHPGPRLWRQAALLPSGVGASGRRDPTRGSSRASEARTRLRGLVSRVTSTHRRGVEAPLLHRLWRFAVIVLK